MLIGAEIQVGGQIIRTDGERGAEVRGCLFGPALAGQKLSQRVMCDVIVLSQRQGAEPERGNVVPVANLTVSEGPQNKQIRNGGNGKPSGGKLVSFSTIGRQPGHHQK